MPAKSKKQQKMFGIARALQKGDISPSKVSAPARKIAKTVSKKDVEDFASTPTKNLPDRVKKEEMKKRLKEMMLPIIRKELSSVIGEVGIKLPDIKSYEDAKTFLLQRGVNSDAKIGDKVTAKHTVVQQHRGSWQNYLKSLVPSLNEHHGGEYPPEVLDMTVSTLLDKIKTTNPELYNKLEDEIEKSTMKTESIIESKERVLYAVAENDPEWKEQIRVATIDLSKVPDFKKTVNKDAADKLLKHFQESQLSKLQEKLGRQLTVPEKHQLAIAYKTMKMPDAGVGVMGGMDKAEAKNVIKRLTGKDYKSQKEQIVESKKRYNTQYNIGKSKYVVNFHDGVKKHKDGSDFFDIHIFHNKKDLGNFTSELKRKGYVSESNEQTNESSDLKSAEVKVQGMTIKIVNIGRDMYKVFVAGEPIASVPKSKLIRVLNRFGVKTLPPELRESSAVDKELAKEYGAEEFVRKALDKKLSGVSIITQLQKMGFDRDHAHQIYYRIFDARPKIGDKKESINEEAPIGKIFKEGDSFIDHYGEKLYIIEIDPKDGSMDLEDSHGNSYESYFETFGFKYIGNGKIKKIKMLRKESINEATITDPRFIKPAEYWFKGGRDLSKFNDATIKFAYNIMKKSALTRIEEYKQFLTALQKEMYERKLLESINESTVRSLSDIAQEISKDWKNVNFAARPYLDAMYSLDKMGDSYGADSAKSIVAYFLSNASSWRGETAKRVKKELLQRLKMRESINETIEVYDERHVGKMNIIMMRRGNENRAAIFKNGKENKYNRNNPKDVATLWKLAGKYPQKPIEEDYNPVTDPDNYMKTKKYGFSPEDAPNINESINESYSSKDIVSIIWGDIGRPGIGFIKRTGQRVGDWMLGTAQLKMNGPWNYEKEVNKTLSKDGFSIEQIRKLQKITTDAIEKAVSYVGKRNNLKFGSGGIQTYATPDRFSKKSIIIPYSESEDTDLEKYRQQAYVIARGLTEKRISQYLDAIKKESINEARTIGKINIKKLKQVVMDKWKKNHNVSEEEVIDALPPSWWSIWEMADQEIRGFVDDALFDLAHHGKIMEREFKGKITETFSPHDEVELSIGSKKLLAKIQKVSGNSVWVDLPNGKTIRTTLNNIKKLEK
jgi:hypothetical protein